MHFCVECAVGQFTATVGQHKCEACAVDKYANALGMSSCEECDYYCEAGQHKPLCGNHVYPDTGKFDSRPGTCQQCAAGHYKAAAGVERQCTRWRTPCTFPAEWQSTNPNHIAERVCTPHPVCIPGPAGRGDPHHVHRAAQLRLIRRVCAIHMQHATTIMSSSPQHQAHNNRVCSPLTTCPAGYFERAEDPTSDRRCSLCPKGTQV